MGYSARVEALERYDQLIKAAQEESGVPVFTSNGWVRDGRSYFAEIGREHSDGAVTGTVMRMVNETQCVPAGGFRIDPDGTVKRFPGIPKRLWGSGGGPRSLHQRRYSLT